MKVVYIMRHPGIASRTPEGWEFSVLSARPDGEYTEEELREVAKADALVVGLEPVTEAIFACATRLKLVQRLGVGYDNVDLEAATRRGIPVCNMPDYNAATVAEHTIMLILALFRRVFESTLLMKAGRWQPSTIVAKGVFDLHGKILGIIGLGSIGQAVATRAKPFGVRIRYYDSAAIPPHVEAQLDASAASLDDLLQQSDIVTIHLPLTPQTRLLMGKLELRKMKRSAVLINTARGEIVDELALAEALEQGIIAGAGLDVFSEEPPSPAHPLLRCPNLVLTPHLAGQTREAMERMTVVMLENLHRVVNDGGLLHRVNAPPTPGDIDRR